MALPGGAISRGPGPGRWLMRALEIALLAVLLAGGGLLVVFGAYTFAHAHTPEPVRISGYVADYREVLVDGAYARNELRLAGDPRTYVLDRSQFHPALPRRFDQDARVVIWVDGTTPDVLAVTLYDVYGLNPTGYTTGGYDDPATALHVAQGEGLLASGVGLGLAAFVVVWLVVRARRARYLPATVPNSRSLLPGLAMRSALAADAGRGPAQLGPRLTRPPLVPPPAPAPALPAPGRAGAPPAGFRARSDGPPDWSLAAPTAPLSTAAQPPAAPRAEPPISAPPTTYTPSSWPWDHGDPGALEEQPTTPSMAIPPAAPPAGQPAAGEPFAAFMPPSDTAGGAPPAGEPGALEEQPTQKAEVPAPPGPPARPARQWRIVGQPYLLPVDSPPPSLANGHNGAGASDPAGAQPESPDETPTQRTPAARPPEGGA